MTKKESDAAYYQKNKEAIKERHERYRLDHKVELQGYYDSPEVKYKLQKSRAKGRGIPFLLTFDEWWGFWKESYHLRGRAADNLQMCRIGDKGAYEVGNIYLDTCSNNTILGHATRGGIYE